MLDHKLKLSTSVLRKYEQQLDLYCFYDSKNKIFWNTSYAVGAVVSVLDGSLAVVDVLDIVLDNNKDLDPELLRETLLTAFEKLYKEGFLVDAD